MHGHQWQGRAATLSTRAVQAGNAMSSPVLPIYLSNDSASPVQHCHSNTMSSRIDSSRGVHIIRTHTRLSLPVGFVLVPHPPYLLAFPAVADDLNQSTKRFGGGGIRGSEDKLWHCIKQEKQREESIVIVLTYGHTYATRHPFSPVLSPPD